AGVMPADVAHAEEAEAEFVHALEEGNQSWTHRGRASRFFHVRTPPGSDTNQPFHFGCVARSLLPRVA
ncbi:MAG: hypothetical protein ACKVYV_09600, partial [Limisphaerales bacterium]